jgi:hypothetical protein
LAIAAAALLFFSLHGQAVAADIALTSVGQSPDDRSMHTVF